MTEDKPAVSKNPGMAVALELPNNYQGIYEWTQSRIHTAYLSAIAGYPEMLSDFLEFARQDPHFVGGLSYRVKGYREVRHWKPGSDSDEARKVLDVVRNYFERDDNPMIADEEADAIHEEGIASSISSIFVGWSRENGLYIPHGEHFPLRSLMFDWPISRRWMAQLKDRSWEPFDHKWHRFIYAPYGTKMHWSKGLWWQLARRIIISYFALGDMGSNAHLASKIWATFETELEDENMKIKLASSLSKTLAQNGIIITGKGEKLNPFDPTSTAHEIFDKILSKASESTAQLVRGGSLSESAKGSTLGVGGAAQAHAKTGDMFRKNDGKKIARLERRSLIAPFVYANYGDRPDLIPYHTYDSSEEQLNTEILADCDKLWLLIEKMVNAKVDSKHIDAAYARFFDLMSRLK